MAEKPSDGTRGQRLHCPACYTLGNPVPLWVYANGLYCDTCELVIWRDMEPVMEVVASQVRSALAVAESTEPLSDEES